MIRSSVSLSVQGFTFLLATAMPALPAFSADTIYTYVDDRGTVNFTDQWESIPDKYRSRVQVIDPATGKPVKDRPRAGQADGPAPPSDAPSQATQPRGQSGDEPSRAAGWSGRLSTLSIPLPSHYQFGVGLATLVLLWGAFKTMRLTANPVLKLLLKVSMVFLLAGGFYAMYLSDLNERMAEETGEPSHPSLTGQDLMKGAQGLEGRVKNAVEHAAAPIKKLQDTTVGEAARTVNKANQATEQEQQVLQQIESSP